MSRRGFTLVLAGGLAVVLGVLTSVLPVPYVVLVPGPVTDTLGSIGPRDNRVPVVSATGVTSYPTQGHLYLTTVGVVPGDCDAHPTLWQALRAWWHEDEAVQPHQAVCPPGDSAQQVQQENEREMAQSQRDAITAALLELGYTPITKHIIVGDLTSGLPAEKVLRAGDVIDTIDGKNVTGVGPLHDLINARPIGSTLRIGITRNGHPKTVQITTVASTDATPRPLIGITPDLSATFRGVKVKIGLDPAKVGGPSAGLAFTLGIVDKLTPGSLTGGRTVAGTGTINGFGIVGPIGGIQQKVAGAVKNGATVFLAPESECADARAVAPKSLTIVKVDTLKTALSALKAIDSGSTAFPHC
ncbi:MAG TPA: PDZ domain-containing protein [Mycobacteriales bacterium]|nr:PDZ domain-containing protein [Mycobacteriales bacterium]